MYQFQLPKLEYDPNDLRDLFSEAQFECHFYGHHKQYIEKLNDLIETQGMKADTLLDILIEEEPGHFFNQAAQAWNHLFYWFSISPNGLKPTKSLLRLLKNSKKNFDSLRTEFIDKGTSIFGSGWVWIILNPNNLLEVVGTRNAKTPLSKNCRPLIVADVWEHAYYVDYQSARKEYLEIFWEKIDWGWAEKIINNKNYLKKVEKLMYSTHQPHKMPAPMYLGH